MPTTSVTIVDSLADKIRGIKTSNGYSTDFTDENVVAVNSPTGQSQPIDMESYPRVYVYSDGASYSEMPGNAITKSEIFVVIALFARAAKDTASLSLAEQVNNFINDFEVLINRNKQLGGSDLVSLRAEANDIGTSETEATCIFELLINYRRRFS